MVFFTLNVQRIVDYCVETFTLAKKNVKTEKRNGLFLLEAPKAQKDLFYYSEKTTCKK